MIAGRDNAIANKGLRENFRLGHARYLNPSPAGKRAAAIARNLKSQQPDFAFLYAVIVRLRGAPLAVKQKTEQALLVDGHEDALMLCRINSGRSPMLPV